MVRFIVALLVVLCLVCPARSEPDWWPSSDPNVSILYDGEVPLGAWDQVRGQYSPWWGVSYGPPCQPPVAPPVSNYGVKRSGLAGRERVLLNGVEVSSDYARKLMSDASELPADRTKPFAVVVGSADQQAKGASTVAAAAAPGNLVRVQCYSPEDLMIRDRTGKVLYTTGITLVRADGKVVGHTNDFAAVEDVREGIRVADPAYNPAAAPALGAATITGGLHSHISAIMVSGAGVALLGGLVLYRFSRRKQ